MYGAEDRRNHPGNSLATPAGSPPALDVVTTQVKNILDKASSTFAQLASMNNKLLGEQPPRGSQSTPGDIPFSGMVGDVIRGLNQIDEVINALADEVRRLNRL